MNRRWRYPYLARRRRFNAPAAAAVPAAFITPERPKPGGRPRRMGFAVVPATVAASPPSWVAPFERPAGRRGTVVRRGHFSVVVPTSPILPPTWPAPLLRPRGRARPGAPRRGEFYALAPGMRAVPPYGIAHRPRLYLPRHGNVLPLSPPPPAPSTGPLPPQLTRRQARAAAPRVYRGQFQKLAWSQQAALPPVTPALSRQSARRVAAIRRGKFQLVPGVGAVVSPQLRQTPRLPKQRAGNAWSPPRGGTAPAVLAMPRQHIRLPSIRRSRLWLLMPATVTAQPPAIVPRLYRGRATTTLTFRRGKVAFSITPGAGVLRDVTVYDIKLLTGATAELQPGGFAALLTATFTADLLKEGQV